MCRSQFPGLREREAILKELYQGNHIWESSSRPTLDSDDGILILSCCCNGMQVLGAVGGEAGGRSVFCMKEGRESPGTGGPAV